MVLYISGFSDFYDMSYIYLPPGLERRLTYARQNTFTVTRPNVINGQRLNIQEVQRLQIEQRIELQTLYRQELQLQRVQELEQRIEQQILYRQEHLEQQEQQEQQERERLQQEQQERERLQQEQERHLEQQEHIEQENYNKNIKLINNVLIEKTQVCLNLFDDNFCVICQDTIYKHPNLNCIMRILECSHCFHINCIDKWFTRSSTCPTCKFELF